ncbi:MAG TPA: ATP-binding protein [Pyrinomonadaceae bacterium]
MASAHQDRILAGRPAIDFIGRETEVARLRAHALSSDGLLLLSSPGAGASELLKQTFDRLFRDQQEIVPFYFAIRRTSRSAADIAASFLDEFVRQLVAFRRQDPSIFRSPVTLEELAELSLSTGGFWMDRLIESVRNLSTPSGTSRSTIRNCLAAPARAAANDARPLVMVDDLHELLNIEGGMEFFEELRDIFTSAGIGFIFSGHRRFLYGQVDCDRIELDHLDFEDASRVVEVFARESRIAVSEAARDLVAAQLGRNASLMRSVIRSAFDAGVGLESFEDVEKTYADSLFGGRLGREFESLFASICRGSEIERSVVSMLFDCQVSETGRVERERWHRRLQLGGPETDSLLNRLNVAELIRLTPVHIETVRENIALSDYVAARFRLTSATEGRAAIFSDSLGTYITRAPEIMARVYRTRSSLGLREVLGSFSGQRVPAALVDYAQFRDPSKGVPDKEVLNKLPSDPSITLPKIFFTTAASSFYKPMAQLAESERSAIALGFEAPGEQTVPDDEVVWIAAEIDSKLEASRELVEFWCDRLEAAAVMCNFPKFKLWLVSPEGFSDEAIEILRTRNAYGSSRRQVGVLRQFLDAPPAVAQPLADNEYEMVIPMRDDAELMAAHAIEEVAKRHHFDSRSINQMKTALVEACINASEHSLSPDGKIHLRFRVDGDRVVLTVSNRGLRLTSTAAAPEPTEGRRGWGLNLMRRLMDEVNIEQVDDGTRIVMTKYLQAAL